MEKHDLDTLVKAYFELKKQPYHPSNRSLRPVYRRFLRPAKELLTACDGKVEEAVRKMVEVKHWADSRALDWTLDTVIKRFFEPNVRQLQPQKWPDDVSRRINPETLDSVRDILKKRNII